MLGLAAFAVTDMRHAALDYLGLNPAKPAVEFEIRLPASALAAIGRDAQVELHTDRNQTIARLQSAAAVDDGRPVLRGSVPIDFRTTDRLVILNLPGAAQHLFKLRLAANPSRTPMFGPWHLADRVGSPATSREAATRRLRDPLSRDVDQPRLRLVRADADQLLAEIGALQQADERLRRALEALGDELRT